MAPNLTDVAKLLNKQFGEMTVMTFADAPSKVPAISTRSLLLDKITGVGGIPKGRITEVFGSPSSGKTTIALQTVAEAHAMGLPCLYLDVEQALDMRYARQLGVSTDPSLFCFAQPSVAEDAFTIAEQFVSSGSVGLVVIDSIAALATRSEVEGNFGDANMGSLARLMGQAMRKLVPAVHKSNTAMLFINQVRTSMGVTYGDPNVTPGGKAMLFAASMRIRMNQSKRIGTEDNPIGQNVIATVVKNKLATPFGRVNFSIMFGKGVSQENEMVKIGTDAGVFQRKGSWYSIEGDNIAQGAEKMEEYLIQCRVNSPAKYKEYLTRCMDYITSSQDLDFVSEETSEPAASEGSFVEPSS